MYMTVSSLSQAGALTLSQQDTRTLMNETKQKLIIYRSISDENSHQCL
jgi:hypothetical protein